MANKLRRMGNARMSDMTVLLGGMGLLAEIRAGSGGSAHMAETRSVSRLATLMMILVALPANPTFDWLGSYQGMNGFEAKPSGKPVTTLPYLALGAHASSFVVA